MDSYENAHLCDPDRGKHTAGLVCRLSSTSHRRPVPARTVSTTTKGLGLPDAWADMPVGAEATLLPLLRHSWLWLVARRQLLSLVNDALASAEGIAAIADAIQLRELSDQPLWAA